MNRIHSFFDHSYRGEFTAFVAGLLTVLSFAPFHCVPLAFIGPAMLLATWLYAPSLRRTFYRGFGYGLGLFGAGVHWVYISIHTFGQSPAWLAFLLTLLLTAILALFPALTGVLLNRFFPNNTQDKMLRAFPAIWTIVEWVRSWIFTGFPWLMLGYSQTEMPTIFITAFLGVLGMSLFVTINSGALVYFIYASRKQRIHTVIYLTSIWLLWWAFSFAHITQPAGDPIKVSLVQGNIAQSLKWQPEQVQPTLDKYTELTESHWDSDLIVWPEGAIPVPMADANDFLDQLEETAHHHDSGLLVGIPVENAFGTAYYNSILALGNAHGTYLKRHLVPFGEQTPALFMPIMKLINIPMSNFTPGHFNQPLITLGDYSIGTYICYEIAFPEDVRQDAAQANFLVAVSDDSWFGDSIAHQQHLQMAQIRAIESGKPVLFSTNDGITAIIDHRGKIVKELPPYTDGVLTGEITPMKNYTIWDYHGLDHLILLCTVMYFSAIYRRRRQPVLVKKSGVNW